MSLPINSSEAADLIDRFVEGRSSYPQEWNDFVEGKHVSPEVEPFRRRCSELDPLVNCPGIPDGDAVIELKAASRALRRISGR
jgi:hypothetical protein